MRVAFQRDKRAAWDDAAGTKWSGEVVVADLTFHQELAKTGLNALGVVLGGGLSLLAGWLLLRRQEHVKREEERAAGLRKIRSDALIQTAEALGRYHNLKDRRLLYEADKTSPPEMLAHIHYEEKRAAEVLVDTLAHQQFLLGSLGDELSRTWQQMARAGTNADLSAAVAPLHEELEKWIPPLEPICPPLPSWKIWPWIATCSVLAAGAPVLQRLVGGKKGFIAGEGAGIAAILVGFSALKRALRTLHAGGHVKIGTDRKD